MAIHEKEDPKAYKNKNTKPNINSCSRAIHDYAQGQIIVNDEN